jgi:hypothetical protein
MNFLFQNVAKGQTLKNVKIENEKERERERFPEVGT